MRIASKVIVVVAVLFLELILLEICSELIFGLSHGQLLDVSYRRQQRMAAFWDYHQNPNPETKARFQEEMRLMHRHEDWKMYLGMGLFLAINGTWIYFYFREKRPTTNKAATPS